METHEIQRLIEEALPDSRAQVRSEDNTHYEALVVCAGFAGRGPVQRHQMVYGALGQRVGREIHALALRTYTPDEWAAAQADAS